MVSCLCSHLKLQRRKFKYWDHGVETFYERFCLWKENNLDVATWSEHSAGERQASFLFSSITKTSSTKGYNWLDPVPLGKVHLTLLIGFKTVPYDIKQIFILMPKFSLQTVPRYFSANQTFQRLLLHSMTSLIWRCTSLINPRMHCERSVVPIPPHMHGDHSFCLPIHVVFRPLQGRIILQRNQDFISKRYELYSNYNFPIFFSMLCQYDDHCQF